MTRKEPIGEKVSPWSASRPVRAFLGAPGALGNSVAMMESGSAGGKERPGRRPALAESAEGNDE